MSSSQLKFFPRTLFDELFGSSIDGPIILSEGAPGVRKLQQVNDIISQATSQLMETDHWKAGNTLQYCPTRGSSVYRLELAKFLSKNYGDTIKAENLFATDGTLGGLRLVMSAFLPRGSLVFLEDPTYFVSIEIVKKHGHKMIAVPTGDFGIDVVALETLLEEHIKATTNELSDKQLFRGMIYLVPAYQNPTAICLAPDRCSKVVELARKYNILVISDDAHNFLRYDDAPLPPKRLLAYDKHTNDAYGDHVISLGTFSKTFAPSLRVGWIEASDRLLKYILNSDAFSGYGANSFSSEVVAMALRSGLAEKHIGETVSHLKKLVSVLCEFLRNNLPDGVTFNVPMGGFVMWLTMPEGARTADLAKIAEEKYNVAIYDAEIFSPNGTGCTNCLRLGFAYNPDDVLMEGTRRLCLAIKDYLSNRK